MLTQSIQMFRTDYKPQMNGKTGQNEHNLQLQVTSPSLEADLITFLHKLKTKPTALELQLLTQYFPFLV